MSMAENIKNSYARQKRMSNPKDEVLDSFNEATLMLMKKFIAEVVAGDKEIEDLTDFNRVLNMFLQMNGIMDGETGEGTLPSLSKEQKNVLGDAIRVQQAMNEDDEDYEYISDDSMENYSAEDIERMLLDREKTMNNENEEAG